MAAVSTFISRRLQWNPRKKNEHNQQLKCHIKQNSDECRRRKPMNLNSQSGFSSRTFTSSVSVLSSESVSDSMLHFRITTNGYLFVFYFIFCAISSEMSFECERNGGTKTATDNRTGKRDVSRDVFCATEAHRCHLLFAWERTQKKKNVSGNNHM